MKLYAIFATYKGGNGYYNAVFQDKNGKHWLGGNHLKPLLFHTKREAEVEKRKVKAAWRDYHVLVVRNAAIVVND